MLTHVGFGGLLTPVWTATAAIVYFGVQSDVVPRLSLNFSVIEASEAKVPYLKYFTLPYLRTQHATVEKRGNTVSRPGRSFYTYYLTHVTYESI